MTTAPRKSRQGIRWAIAAIIMVCVMVLTGMAEPQVKSAFNTQLPPDLSDIQSASFTPMY